MLEVKKVFYSTFQHYILELEASDSIFGGKASFEKKILILFCNMNSQFLSLARKLGFRLELLALNIHTFEYINSKKLRSSDESTHHAQDFFT